MDEPLSLPFAHRRVLGVLIEKSLATPDSYPLTLNAIVNGCNQKQNRAPLTELEESEIGRVVHELMQRDLVRLAPVGSGARSNRFQHQVEEHLMWGKPQQAVMAELLLRGPQTVGELRTRGGRMHAFADLAAVTRVLDELAAREPAQTRALPREPGRSAIRHTHLFYPADEATPPASTPPPAAAAPSAAAPPAPAPTAESSALRERVERLESRIEQLERRVAELRRASDAHAGPPSLPG